MSWCTPSPHVRSTRTSCQPTNPSRSSRDLLRSRRVRASKSSFALLAGMLSSTPFRGAGNTNASSRPSTSPAKPRSPCHNHTKVRRRKLCLCFGSTTPAGARTTPPANCRNRRCNRTTSQSWWWYSREYAAYSTKPSSRWTTRFPSCPNQHHNRRAETTTSRRIAPCAGSTRAFFRRTRRAEIGRVPKCSCRAVRPLCPAWRSRSQKMRW